MADDPIARFRRWYAAAGRARVPLHDAMALATADGRGRPSVRYVLLKGADERGFTFFTDGRSRKGRELAAHPRASVAFYWDATGKQVRIEGRIVPDAIEFWQRGAHRLHKRERFERTRRGWKRQWLQP